MSSKFNLYAGFPEYKRSFADDINPRDAKMRTQVGNMIWVLITAKDFPRATVEEIAAHWEMSRTLVYVHLSKLRKLGYLPNTHIPSKAKYRVPIPSKTRWEVWERDNFTCQHCGQRKDLAVDHIRPESKGGSLDMDNLQTLCRSCNSKKGNG